MREITENLKQNGFDGFKTIGELKENQKGIPEEQGVYVVLYSQPQEPSFLEKGTGGFFKDKNPNVEISELKANWVDGEGIVYIGKAGGGNSKATLKSRLAQYLKFGMGRKIGHWGGRYIWQLADADSLIVCWKTTMENPRGVEADMIAKFKAGHDGRRPFANLSD